MENSKTKFAKPLFTAAIVLTGIAGLGNLALSQIHIGTITRIFAPEIGFYFFLYIIFGLVTFMNALNMQKKTSTPGNAILLILFAVLATVVGIIYARMLLADVAMENLLTYSEIAMSLYVAIGSVAIYGLGGLIILITNKDAKRGM